MCIRDRGGGGRGRAVDHGAGGLQGVPSEVPRERGPHRVGPRDRGGARTPLAGQRGRRTTGQGIGEQRGVRLVLGVRVRVAAALHALRGDRERQLRVVLHLDQVVVEDPRRVGRVHDLLLGAPALRGPLLEQAQRVPVAMLDVAQRGLLERGRQGYGHRPLGQVPPGADGGDRRRVHGLLRRELVHRRVVVARDDLAARRSRASGDVLHHEIARHREQDHEGRPETEEAATASGSGGQLWHASKVLESKAAIEIGAKTDPTTGTLGSEPCPTRRLTSRWTPRC